MRHYVELRRKKLDEKMRQAHECVVALRSCWSVSTTSLRLCHLSSRRTTVPRHKGCRSVLHTNKSLVSLHGAVFSLLSDMFQFFFFFILLLRINKVFLDLNECRIGVLENIDSPVKYLQSLVLHLPSSEFLEQLRTLTKGCSNSTCLAICEAFCFSQQLFFFLLPTHAVHEVLLCTLLMPMPSDHSATLLDFAAFAHAMRSCCACCSLIVCCFAIQGVHLMIQSVSRLCIIKDCVFKFAVATHLAHWVTVEHALEQMLGTAGCVVSHMREKGWSSIESCFVLVAARKFVALLFRGVSMPRSYEQNVVDAFNFLV